MKNWIFILIFLLFSCSDSDRDSNGSVTIEQSKKIKEYIDTQVLNKEKVDLKKKFGKNW